MDDAADEPADDPRVIDFAALPAAACPCGLARRAFAEASGGACSVHRVDVTADAVAHYHQDHAETYVFLECGPDAAMELDGRRFPVRAGMSVHIPPGTRHRAVGEMTILNFVVPAFDPADEFEDP